VCRHSKNVGNPCDKFIESKIQGLLLTLLSWNQALAEVKIVIEKLKRYNSQGIDLIRTETRDWILLSEKHTFKVFI
jgi:hypothetical protein